MTCYSPPRTLMRSQPPTLEPITLADAKRYLRLDHLDEDMLILQLIQAAREMAENYLALSLMPQQWQLSLAGGVPERLVLPMGPVRGFVSFTTLISGTIGTVDPARYQFTIGQSALSIPGGLIGGTFTVTYDTGFSSAETIPMAIRQGILAHLAALYADREASAGLPAASLAFYAPYREVRI